MKIQMLVENTSGAKEIKKKHGLSIYISTPEHHILFDVGSNKLLLENAVKMGIKIEQIDSVIISHGHVDHGGGLHSFLGENKNAEIYIHETAFQDYYTKVMGCSFYVGLDSELQNNSRIRLTKETCEIDKELTLFSDVQWEEDKLTTNSTLFIKKEGSLERDTFTHEQSLLIKEKNKYILFAGCAHRGIENIMRRAEAICGQEIDCVIGGFHLTNPLSKKHEGVDFLKELADTLMKKSTVYYTCHCTGSKAYSILKSHMGEQLNYLSAGEQLLL